MLVLGLWYLFLALKTLNINWLSQTFKIIQMVPKKQKIYTLRKDIKIIGNSLANYISKTFSNNEALPWVMDNITNVFKKGTKFCQSYVYKNADKPLLYPMDIDDKTFSIIKKVEPFSSAWKTMLNTYHLYLKDAEFDIEEKEIVSPEQMFYMPILKDKLEKVELSLAQLKTNRAELIEKLEVFK